MTASQSNQAIVANSSGVALRQAGLFALVTVVFGAILVLVAAALCASQLNASWGGSVAIGGCVGLLVSGFVFYRWMRALALDGQAVWRSFSRGFLLKLAVLVGGTFAIKFFAPALVPAGFAVAFAAGLVWVNILGVPYIHRKLGAQRG